MALLLDNHVNRPGYIKGCLKSALGEMQNNTPNSWTTSDEGKFLEAYLEIRKSYGNTPMTEAEKRAAVTKNYVDSGTISAARNSFKTNQQAAG